MSSADEVDANDATPEQETQFVARSGDEDVLWEVKEITAERGKRYKVKWAGKDPATGKPWAQSWVAKHDCTNDLVAEWKAKQKRLAAGKGGGSRASTMSRASGASKRTGPSSLGTKTRRSRSKTTPSRQDSIDQPISPPKRIAAKRKRQRENIATSSGGSVQADDRNESPRPRKKQKTLVDALLPTISSDEDEDAQAAPESPREKKAAPRSKVLSKGNGTSLDVSDEDHSSPPKAKARYRHRSDARPKDTAVDSRASDGHDSEPRLHRLKTKATVVLPRRERIMDPDLLSTESEDEDLRPPKLKKKPASKRKSPSEQANVSEKDDKSSVTLMKVGPPRGVKRHQLPKRRAPSRKSGSPHDKPPEEGSTEVPIPTEEPGPSRTEHREEKIPEKDPPSKESTGNHDWEVPSFGSPLLLQESVVNDRISPPSQIPDAHPRNPSLSPGAKARLKLFDQMMEMEDPPQPGAVSPPPSTPQHIPDDAHVNLDTHDAFDTHDQPPLTSPLRSESKHKHSAFGTPNGLIVPETESSGNFQGQSQPLLKSPAAQPPLTRDKPSHKLVDLPTIAVIAPSVASSSASRQVLFPPREVPNYPSKKPTSKANPNTFRPTTNARWHVNDADAPPSSIESFTSPQRADKGKQRAVEDDKLQSSLSEGWEDSEHRKKQTKKRTESELKKRGKELFNQAQLTRETQWLKNKKSTRLKTLDEIVKGSSTLSSKGLPLPVADWTKSPLEGWEGVVDLSGGGNSITLDTPEHREAQSLSEEKRDRLRFELREEEEESTQEALGIHPPPVKESEANNDSGLPEGHPFSGQIGDVDRMEQPSTELYRASVMVQASQGRHHEEMDVEALPNGQPVSSPSRPIPENLTDSPKRRLGEALSLLNVKSEEIQRLERELSDERKGIQGLKVQLSELQQSSEPTAPIRTAWEAERAQWGQERSKWENDTTVWETQRKEMSEENANLLARLAKLEDTAVRAEEARLKLLELEAERVAWIQERDVMQKDITHRSEELVPLAKLRQEYAEDRSKWEAERASWAEEKAKWEIERTTLQEERETRLRAIDELTISFESMKSAKDSAEQDKEFFREQYAQASGFVGSVRQENVELEKRVKIAEGQAQVGVATIKALFEGRVKAVQADADHWRGLAELLQERDRRTNDELRQRAAEVPELNERCARLTAENESLGAIVQKLDQAQRRSILRVNKLFYEILLLKKERISLKSKLSKLAKITDNNAQETSGCTPESPLVPEDLDPENIDPNDMDFLPDVTQQTSGEEPELFPCMWRPQWRDLCQQSFDTKEDLERHMQEHFCDLVQQ